MAVTVMLVPVTVPTAGLMLIVSAFVTAQVSVTGELTTTDELDAVKLVIVGAPVAASTVTVTEAVVVPTEFTAVSV